MNLMKGRHVMSVYPFMYIYTFIYYSESLNSSNVNTLSCGKRIYLR